MKKCCYVEEVARNPLVPRSIFMIGKVLCFFGRHRWRGDYEIFYGHALREVCIGWRKCDRCGKAQIRAIEADPN